MICMPVGRVTLRLALFERHTTLPLAVAVFKLRAGSLRERTRRGSQKRKPAED
jgi:hypothetical protein